MMGFGCSTTVSRIKIITCPEKNVREGEIAWLGLQTLPIIVIGKSKTPRYKNIKQLPCRYRNQRKSWMTGERFKAWVKMLDYMF